MGSNRVLVREDKLKRMRGTFKIAILLIVFVLPSAILHAQQDALFSQYMFNPFVVNPAYAGSRSSISTVIMAREQWVGFEGSPGIGTFSVHAPIIGKMAVGFNCLILLIKL